MKLTAKTQACAAGLIGFALSLALAQEYTVRDEGWSDGNLEGWYDSDPAGKMTLQLYMSPGGNGSLSGLFNAQSVPFPETDAFVADAASSGGQFAGDYLAEGYTPQFIGFDFLPLDILPSYLWLRFSGYDGLQTNTFRALLTNQLTSVGAWHAIQVPLDHDTNLWLGGTAAQFSNTLSAVDWVDLRVTRNSTVAQTYYLDNFALTLLVPGNIATNDTDGDGLPDFWEEAYFNNPTNAVPGDDGDGDGFNNEQERFAGTDPTDWYSHLYIRNVMRTSEWAVIFPSVPGRRYQVDYRESTDTNAWTSVSNTVDGSGGFTTLSFTNASTSAWYRLKVRMP